MGGILGSPNTYMVAIRRLDFGERQVHWNLDCFRVICMGTLPSLSIRSVAFILLAAAVVIPPQLFGCNAGCDLSVRTIVKKSAHSCCFKTTENLAGEHNSHCKQGRSQSGSHRDCHRMDSAFAKPPEPKESRLQYFNQKLMLRCAVALLSSTYPSRSPIFSALILESLPKTEFLSLAPGSSPPKNLT